ncbi:hypothetical protein SNE40_020483 [Patella caerulea]|uniref:Uncharacterized protein n=1 Tax=Patella caerulea TaxID=87958 RepID=A0AAN8GK14_PATCE
MNERVSVNARVIGIAYVRGCIHLLLFYFFSAAFWGDIALSDEDAKREQKYLQQINNTLFELQVEDPRRYTYTETDNDKSDKGKSKAKGKEPLMKIKHMDESMVKEKRYLRKVLKEKVQILKGMCKTG